MTGRAGARAALAVAAVLGPALAFAGHLDQSDPRDTRGLLDVRKIDVRGTSKVRWTIATRRAWTKDELEGRGYFAIRIDTFGSRRFDYFALLYAAGGRIEGVLWRDRKVKPDYPVGPITAWKPGARSVRAAVVLSDLHLGGDRVTWAWLVKSLFTNDRCRRTCIDRVPDEGRIVEPMPLATPTVEPTPTTPPGSA